MHIFRKRIAFSPEGLAKASFALPYGGGMLWCEHLDSLGDHTDEAIAKLHLDAESMARPSSPALLAVVLDETRLAPILRDVLVHVLIRRAHRVMKVAFVGLSLSERRGLRAALQKRSAPFSFAFINDLEAAKAWLIAPQPGLS